MAIYEKTKYKLKKSIKEQLEFLIDFYVLQNHKLSAKAKIMAEYLKTIIELDKFKIKKHYLFL